MRVPREENKETRGVVKVEFEQTDESANAVRFHETNLSDSLFKDRCIPNPTDLERSCCCQNMSLTNSYSDKLREKPSSWSVISTENLPAKATIPDVRFHDNVEIDNSLTQIDDKTETKTFVPTKNFLNCRPKSTSFSKSRSVGSKDGRRFRKLSRTSKISNYGTVTKGSVSKDYVVEFLNNRNSFLVSCVIALTMGIIVGVVSGLGILTSFRRTSSECGEDEIMCNSFGCISKALICSGDMKQHCGNILDICMGNSTQAGIAKEAWKELQSENLQKTIIDIPSPILEVPEKDVSGWVYFSKGSSNGSKYIVVNKLLTFYGAQDQCRKLGGHLAHINTIKEQIFLEDFLSKELQTGEQLQGSVGFWLGARRPRGGHAGSCMFDQWKWVDSYGRSHGTIKGFSAFIPGKPDNVYSPEECLYMAYNKGFHENRFLKWDDAPCDLHIFGGIKSLCEVELP